MSRYADTAADFVAEVEAHPLLRRIEAHDTVVTIHGYFSPGDAKAYVSCDATVPSILSLLPMTYPGIVWGADDTKREAWLSGGYFRLSKSGVGKRYVNAVAKAAREKGLL